MYDFAVAESDDVLPKQPAGPFIPASLPSSCPGTNGEGILQLQLMPMCLFLLKSGVTAT